MEEEMGMNQDQMEEYDQEMMGEYDENMEDMGDENMDQMEDDMNEDGYGAEVCYFTYFLFFILG